VRLLWSLVLALLLGLLAACSARVPAPETPTPEVRGTAPAESTFGVRGYPLGTPWTPVLTQPPVAPAVPVDELVMGMPVDLPEHLSIVVDAGCFSAWFDALRQACGTGAKCRDCPPAPGLVRLYRLGDGSPRYDVLLSINSLRERMNDANLGIGRLLVGRDGSISMEIVPSAGPDGQRDSILRSADGGVTWRDAGMLPPGANVFGQLIDGRLLISTVAPPGRTTPVVRTFPDLEEVAPVPANPWSLDSSRLRGTWRVVGNTLVPFPPADDIDLSPLFPGRRGGIDIVSVIAKADGTRLASVDGGTGDMGWYLVAATSEGRLMRAFHSPVSLTVLSLVSPDELYAGVSGWKGGSVQPDVGVLINLKMKTIRPIRWPADAGSAGRKTVLTVQRGPFARVANTDSCLNIREGMGPDRPSLECVADGVLLRRLGPPFSADGAQWLHVTSPGGTSGWANTQYLEE